jgi:hypothetical protein
MMRMVVVGFGLGWRLATLSRFDCWPCLDDMAYLESVEYFCIGPFGGQSPCTSRIIRLKQLILLTCYHLFSVFRNYGSAE